MTDPEGPPPQPALELLTQATQLYFGGDARQALEVVDQAIAVATGTDDRDIPRSSILLQKAGWLRETGHTDQAATVLTQAESELSATSPAGREHEWSMLRMEQAMIAMRRGDLARAEPLFQEADAFARASVAADLALPDVLANKASLYMDQGRLNDAQNALAEALQIDQRVGNTRNLANDFNMLGLLYQQLGDAETARVYFTQSFQIANEAGLPKEAADAANNMAALLDDRGEHEAAGQIFRDTGDAYREMGFETGSSVANEGLAAALGRDFEAARPLLEQAYQLHSAEGDWVHGLYDQFNLCQIELRTGNLERATSLARAALEQATTGGLVGMLWAMELAVSQCQVEASSRLLDKEPGKAMALMEEALGGLRRAADDIELLRSALDRPEEREWLLLNKEQVYFTAMAICGALSLGAEAFRFGERARARAVMDSLGQRRLGQLDQLADLGTRRQELVQQLLDPAVDPAEKPRLLDDLRVERAAASARAPVVASITGAELPSNEDIAAAIAPGAVLIEYFQAGRSLFVFALDQTGLILSTMVSFDQDSLDDIVRAFREEVEHGDPDLPAGHTLFLALVHPVMPVLAEVENVIVVPHGVLHYVPFSALWYVPEGEGAPPRIYLKNRFFLSEVPSAGFVPLMADAGPAASSSGPPVVLGNPTGDLPGAAAEATGVADALGVAPLLGPAATVKAFFGAGSPAVLHVASHGSYNDDDPLLSGLVLSDGLVTVEDILLRGPSPQLLVLSGCLTGMSERRPGDELIGLSRAALMRGTRSVVASLWETSDEASALFFAYFYAALQDGATVSQAMGFGHDRVAGTDGYDSPVDWAPFVLLGDGNTTL